MSLGEVITRAFTDVDTTPQDGHAAAARSAVTTCTTRVPSAQRSTRSTRTPGSPNNNVVASVTALGSFPRLNASQHSDFKKDRGPHSIDTPRTRSDHRCPLKIEEPRIF